MPELKDRDRNLELSRDSSRSCSQCYFFYLLQMRWPADDGKCSQFDDFVRADFICDKFISAYSSHEPDVLSSGHTPDLARDEGKEII